MKLLKIVIIIIISISISFSQLVNKHIIDSAINILFVGNSLTGENMPEMVFELAKESGKSINVDKFIRAGKSLLEISQNNAFSEKLFSDNWDYLVLQDSPYRVAYPNDFPTYPTRTALDTIINYISSLDIKLIFFLPYAYKDGMSWYMNFTDDYFKMQEKIYNNTLEIGSEYNLLIAPVGWAWYNVMLQKNDVELFLSDMTHPTTEGKYLSACVIYSTVFRELLGSNQFHSTITSSTANYLQNVASGTVLDGFEKWNYLFIDSNQTIKENLILHQNHPNPFNPRTSISFDLPERTNVELVVYDLIGTKVKNLVNEIFDVGSHLVYWDGTNRDGKNVSSGVYIYSLKTEDYNISKKMIYLH